MGGPFGRYGEGVAAIAALSIIFSWLVGHLFNSGAVSTELNNAAILALGYIFGRPQQAIESVATLAKAAHDRLDQVNAPPASSKNGNGK